MSITSSLICPARHGMVGSFGTSSVMYLIVATFCLTFATIALSAVWSRKAFRPRAALEVLKIALEFLKAIMFPPGGSPLA